MRRPMLFPGHMPRRLLSGRRQLGLLQMLIMAAALLSALALVWLAHGMNATQHKIQLPYTAAAMNGGLPGQGRVVPRSLEFPLWWHAPFVAQSGLGAEAIMIIESLIATRQMRADDIYVTHSGDNFDQKVLRSFSPATRNMLAHRQHPQQVADEWVDLLFPAQKVTQLQRLADMHDTRKAIAVCHNWFDCWHRAGEMPSNMPGCPCPLSRNRTAFTVARTMFETVGLPAHLADHVKAMDEVWVPTQFNKETFTKAGVNPAKIRVVPEAIDTDLWDPSRYSPVNLSRLGLVQATGPPLGPNTTLPAANMMRGKLPVTGKKPYVFLAVFKWEARKGWKDLIQGFTAAFRPSDPAVLWILARPFMESGTDFDQKVRSYAASLHSLTDAEVSTNLPRIYTSARHLSEEDFVRVYRAASALVLPTHGEGWGRPQLEAMAMGLPVITTNWSGPTAFMNDHIAYPLAIDGLSEVRSDGDPNFFQAFIGQQWAQPSVKHLTQLLLHVFRNPDEAAAKGAAARRHIQEHYTPHVLARIIASEVQRLQGAVRQRQHQRRRNGGGSGFGSLLGMHNMQGVATKRGVFSKLGVVQQRGGAELQQQQQQQQQRTDQGGLRLGLGPV